MTAKEIKSCEDAAIEYFAQQGLDISTKEKREALSGLQKMMVLNFLFNAAEYYQ